MSDIWWFTPWLPEEPGLDELGDYCRFTNSEELARTRLAAHERAPSNFPTARLQITLKTFALDCFVWPAYAPGEGQQAFMLVSQDLRDAMALAPQDIEYLPVDASLSAPVPRAKNYMIMRVTVVENVFDPDQSDYEIRNIVGLPKNFISATRIAARTDAKPAHEIFQDSFFPGIFCTDKFAVKLLQSRCSGVRFYDPAYFDSNPMYLRTVRGIEEETWDPVQEKFHTKLLQAIP
jgi:hypothetical protein